MASKRNLTIEEKIEIAKSIIVQACQEVTSQVIFQESDDTSESDGSSGYLAVDMSYNRGEITASMTRGNSPMPDAKFVISENNGQIHPAYQSSKGELERLNWMDFIYQIDFKTLSADDRTLSAIKGVIAHSIVDHRRLVSDPTR